LRFNQSKIEPFSVAQKSYSLVGAKIMVKKQSSAFSLVLLLASAPQLLSKSSASAFPLLAASGTDVRINGSGSMGAVNQSLKQRFEKQFPNTQVSLKSGGTAAGLQAVLEGNADLAAIARPLTAKEEAQGLVAVPVGRDKIAIVIGSNNKLSKGLDINQFAKIFRGEIKNWSQVGGAAGAIRLVDRPPSNDTRQAFRNYPVFKGGKFESGATAQKLSDDSPQAVIQALGNNGISYLPLSQVRNQPGVKAVLMHGTAPTNARYPFSQPLFYVYKGATPNPAAAAFLSYATTSAGQQAVKQTGAVAVKGAEPIETSTNATEGKPAASKKPAKGAKATSLTANQKAGTNLTNNQVAQVPATGEMADGGLFGDLGLPSWLWWLFPLGSLAALFWMLGKGRDSQRPPSIPAYRDPNPDFPGGFDPLQAEARLAGGATLAGEAAAWEPDDRNEETTDQSDWLFENPNLTPPTTETRAEEAFLADDRDLTTEPEDDTTWGTPTPGFGLTNALSGGAALAGGAGAAAWSFLSGNRRRSDSPSDISQMPAPALERAEAMTPLENRKAAGEGASRLVLSPRNAQWAYAYWDIPRSLKADVERQGGENLVLRLYDVTGLSVDAHLPEQYEQFECDDFALSCDVPISTSDRTYVAEIGYLSADHQWLSLARSTPTWVSAHERMG
jgi:phosphate transport system substrate-binding protein